MTYKDRYFLYTYEDDEVVPRDITELETLLPYLAVHCYFGHDKHLGMTHIYKEEDGKVEYKGSVDASRFLQTAKVQVAELSHYQRENCKKAKDLPRFINVPYLGVVHAADVAQVIKALKQYIRDNRG